MVNVTAHYLNEDSICTQLYGNPSMH